MGNYFGFSRVMKADFKNIFKELKNMKKKNDDGSDSTSREFQKRNRNYKKKQIEILELKTIITEMVISTVDLKWQKKESMNLKINQSIEIIQSEEQREKSVKKTEQNLREMWETITHINIPIVGVSEKQGRGKKTEKII